MPTAAQCSQAGQGGGANTPSTFLACAGLSDPGPANDQQLQAFLTQSGAPPQSDSQHGWVSVVGVAMLRLNRMIFAAQNYNGAGPTEDCPTVPTSTGVSIDAITLQSAQQALGLTGQGISAATGSSLGTVAAAGGVLGDVATAIPIAGAVISLFTSIFAIFAIHAQRVVQEEDLLCNVCATYNAMVAQIEASLSAGQLTPSQAAQLLANTAGALIARMKAFVAYKYGDAEWGYAIIMESLVAYNANTVYPSLGGITAGGVSIPGVGNLSGTTIFWIAVGLFVAKELGVI